MKKYNILILSNEDNAEFLEDSYVKAAFEEDGNNRFVRKIRC